MLNCHFAAQAGWPELIEPLRREFNRQFTEEKYKRFLAAIDAAAGTHVDFRCSETPVFFAPALLDQMARFGRELVEQIEANPAYRRASDATIPEQFRVPDEAPHPLFVQADFGLVAAGGGDWAPKLVEIQGFPSLYGFQPVLAAEYKKAYGLDGALRCFLGGLTDESYLALFRRAVLGGHRPQDVILLEIDPYRQKTLADFLVTERMLGIRIANISEVEKRGRKLYHAGMPVERIYNRVIVDELLRREVPCQFRFNDDLEVEWAGHPNWFFRLSKFSLPWFRHECVPETHFLNELDAIPGDLEQWVLKPLFSFAGLGVKVGPSCEDIEAIPIHSRGDYILQRRMDFAAPVLTPSGPTKLEVRIMYIRDDVLQPVTTIIRTGRGKMMGVDFNKNLDWVGASAGLF
jgi:hypothetical protein